MSHTRRVQRGAHWYLYRQTSRREKGEVKTVTDYLGPEGKGIRQAVDEELMRELSSILLRPGLDKDELKRIARKYRLEMPADEPRKIVLENHLVKKTLYVWIK
jgi:hypothetical protein